MTSEDILNKILSEEWRDIIGYNGLYMVSSLGRVKSLRKISSKGSVIKKREVKISNASKGYKSVVLGKNGKFSKHYLHRLVAMAFVDGFREDLFVNHIDENKANNEYTNLEWITHRANLNYSKNKRSTSAHPGVSWSKKARKWIVQCSCNNKRTHLGSFYDEEIAAMTYIDFCNKNNIIYK